MLGRLLKRYRALLLAAALIAALAALLMRMSAGIIAPVAAAPPPLHNASPLLSCGGWRVIQGDGQGELQGVAALSENNAWAVGSNGSVSFIEHWNGANWSTVASPNMAGDNTLKSVSAVSANDAWAVGSTKNPGHTLIEHWNGARWSVATDAVSGSGELNGVAVLSADDVWAVGDRNGQALIEHWNGARWSTVPAANFNGRSTILMSVSGSSANDIWAVGTAFSNSPSISAPDVSIDLNNLGQPVIEHWNGTSWQLVSQPDSSAMEMLAGVTALAPNDAWAVGAVLDGSLSASPLIEHWNGSSWSEVSSPSTSGSLADYLSSVAALSPTNIWAVGVQMSGLMPGTLIEHWNGQQWSVVPGPNDDNGQHMLLGAAADRSSGRVWAVGNDGSTNGHMAPAILSNCG